MRTSTLIQNLSLTSIHLSLSCLLFLPNSVQVTIIHLTLLWQVLLFQQNDALCQEASSTKLRRYHGLARIISAESESVGRATQAMSHSRHARGTGKNSCFIPIS
jgi:hypothetical protein